MTASPPDDVEAHLAELADAGHATFREQRGLWQLTAEGREAHREQLAADLEGIDPAEALGGAYPDFVEVNGRFKELCGEWQLRDGQPNDHGDDEYDRAVIGRLRELHAEARPLVASMGEELDRLGPYAPRLDSVLGEIEAGDTTKFTGVMCGSYHDVWMELHEDLILTQGIDRDAEGSY